MPGFYPGHRYHSSEGAGLHPCWSEVRDRLITPHTWGASQLITLPPAPRGARTSRGVLERPKANPGATQAVILRARVGGLEVGEGLPVRIMGVINTSPESFYPGSVAASVEEAVRRAEEMVSKGADVIDVGGMSTAPYKKGWVPEEVEAERVVPVVKRLKKDLGVLVSVDTTRASVADKALRAGADAVNDVSGCRHDKSMSKVVADHGASLVLAVREDESKILHGDPVADVRANLRECINRCVEAGVGEERIVIDPGIGFFRNTGIPWYEWDFRVLSGIRRLYALLRPVLVGVSRKSFIGRALGLSNPEDRLLGSIAAEAVAVVNGAHMIRTHNVGETKQSVVIAEKSRRAVRFYEHKGLRAIDLSEGFNRLDVRDLIETLGSEEDGARIMHTKGEFKLLLVTGIPRVLAIVLKQEMLAVGGELATPRGTLLSGPEPTTVLLMGTVNQCRRVVRRLRTMSLESLRRRGLVDAPDLATLVEDSLELR